MAEADSYIWKSLFPESPRRRPCHRSKQAACCYDGQIYIYGGRDGNQTLSDFWRYDVLTNIWTRLECGGDTPPPLQEHTMVAQRECLFIFGGELGYGSCGETPLWVYSITRQMWEKPVIESEVMTPVGRRGHTAVVWRGGMHMYGGYVDLKGSSSELWTLDFETRWWHLSVDAQLENSPSPRHWHSAIVHDSNMWVYGGLCNLQPLRDLWRWNFVSRQWMRIRGRQSPSFLHGHSAVRVADSMMIFGGEDSAGEYRNELWRFHFGSSSWHCATPNRKISPTPCTRHVMLSIPSNHIMSGSHLSLPPAGDARPQSAPIQAHRDGSQEGGAVGTPLGHLADMFVLRPHSSPPVVGNEMRKDGHRIHHFINRVHPSAEKGIDPLTAIKRTLFDSDEDSQDCLLEDDAVEDVEDGELTPVAPNEDARTFSQGDVRRIENGKWAVPVTAGDVRVHSQRVEGRMENGMWAVTSSVSHTEAYQVQEEETSKLLINEESPVHRRSQEERVVHLGEEETDLKSCLRQRDGEWILEDIVSEPTSPVPSTRTPANMVTSPKVVPESCMDVQSITTLQKYALENRVGSNEECNNLVKVDKLNFQLPKNDTSNLRTTSSMRLNNGCDIYQADSTIDNHYSTDYSESYSDNHDGIEGDCTSKTELPSVQEPEEEEASIERVYHRKTDVIKVRPQTLNIHKCNNLEKVKPCIDTQQLLSSEKKPVATFVNLGFASSQEDLCSGSTPQGMDFQIQQTRPLNVNGSVDQSDGMDVPVSQSGATLYGQNRRDLQFNSDAFSQSKPPTLTVNGAANHPTNQSQPRNSNHRLHRASPSEQLSNQQLIHVKPTNHSICRISEEEQCKPSDQSKTGAHQLQQSQRSIFVPRVDAEGNSRPRLHGRSQTLNSLPQRNHKAQESPQTMRSPGQSWRQGNEHRSTHSPEEEEGDTWNWPVFLYLMGGEETGSCSLHQNASPMSVWKCCIVQGKPSDSEIQHILSQY